MATYPLARPICSSRSLKKQSERWDVVGHFARLGSLSQAIVRMQRPARNGSVQKVYFWCPLVAVIIVFFFSKSYFSWAYAVAGLSYAHTDKARRSPVFYPGTSTTLQCYVVALCKAAFMTACTAAPLVPRFLVVANTVALVRLRIYLFLRPSSSHV